VTLVFLGACLLLALAAPQKSSAATFTYQAQRLDSPAPQADGRWAERTAPAGDINGDGTPDFWVGDPRYASGGVLNSGRVWLVSGRTGQVIYSIGSPEIQTNALFGFWISVPGDVTGDGKADIVIGTDSQDVYVGPGSACGQSEPNGCNEDQGKAWVFSGADGNLVYSLNNPHPQSLARFGSRIGSAGDLNGDGRPEIIVGASNNDVPADCGNPGPAGSGCHVNEGEAFIFDGATGVLIRTLNLPVTDEATAPCSSNCGNLGLTVQTPGDINNDGVPDQLVDASTYGGVGREYIFSGVDGSVIRTIDSPEPQAGDNFGFQEEPPNAPGDVNGDGIPDLYANGFVHNGPAGAGEGAAWVFSGATGDLLYKLTDPTPTAGGQFGWSLARTDFNGDGIPDLYVGQSPHHVDAVVEDGGSYVFDGRTGTPLASFELPAADHQDSTSTNGGPRLGWTLSAPGDLNGDGAPDYLAGAPFEDVGANRDQGVLYAFMSQASPTSPPSTTPPFGTPAKKKHKCKRRKKKHHAVSAKKHCKKHKRKKK
jgi:hypothetical protein